MTSMIWLTVFRLPSFSFSSASSFLALLLLRTLAPRNPAWILSAASASSAKGQIRSALEVRMRGGRGGVRGEGRGGGGGEGFEMHWNIEGSRGHDNKRREKISLFFPNHVMLLNKDISLRFHNIYIYFLVLNAFATLLKRCTTSIIILFISDHSLSAVKPELQHEICCNMQSNAGTNTCMQYQREITRVTWH